jgi:hypothetical protein
VTSFASLLEGTEWRKLLAAIPSTTLRDLRDRALMLVATSCGRIAPGVRPPSSHQAKNRAQARA